MDNYVQLYYQLVERNSLMFTTILALQPVIIPAVTALGGWLVGKYTVTGLATTVKTDIATVKADVAALKTKVGLS
jgi:hypothetical protein